MSVFPEARTKYTLHKKWIKAPAVLLQHDLHGFLGHTNTLVYGNECGIAWREVCMKQWPQAGFQPFSSEEPPWFSSLSCQALTNLAATRS